MAMASPPRTDRLSDVAVGAFEVVLIHEAVVLRLAHGPPRKRAIKVAPMKRAGGSVISAGSPGARRTAIGVAAGWSRNQ